MLRFLGWTQPGAFYETEEPATISDARFYFVIRYGLAHKIFFYRAASWSRGATLDSTMHENRFAAGAQR